MTRQAYALDRITQHAVPRRRGHRRRGPGEQPGDAAEHPAVGLARAAGHAAADPGDPHLLRLPRHRHRSLRRSTASVRQMMLAARELNVEKLPESSRNWINEKLIYTHGYGVTMNSVNGFTPEGLPTLILSNMPVQSTMPEPDGDAPGDLLRRAHQHRRLREDAAEGVQLPAGRRPTTSRRTRAPAASCSAASSGALLIALDRGDLAKLPFSDDVTADSRLLMRRNVRERVATLAPFLTFDPDPYIVIGDERPAVLDDGRLHDVGQLSVRAALPPRQRPHQLHAEQREGGHRRVRRHDDVLRLRRRGSDHRRLPRHLPGALQGRVGDARRTCGSTSATRSCC